MSRPKFSFIADNGSNYPEWVTSPLGNEAFIFDGTHQTPKYTQNGIPFVSVEDINTLSSPTKYISKEAYLCSFKPSCRAKQGDVFMTRIGDIGTSNICPENDIAYYVSLALLKGKNNLLNNFLNFAIQSNEFQSELRRRSIHTAFPQKINTGEIGKCLISFPCKEEQKKIASFFSTLDEKIELSERKLEALEQLKKGLMQKIFNQEIRFKRSDGSMYKNWEGTRISRLFNFIRNGFVGTIAPHYTDKNNGIRYLQGTNIHNGRISDNVEYYVTKEFNQAHSKNILKHDDILMVQSGHVGECAVVGNYAGSNCHALVIMSNAGTCSSDYIRFYFESSIGKRQLALISVGNTVKHILASDVSKLSVLIPEIEEQEKIANLFLSIEKRIDIVEKQLVSLRQLKKGFMQQMFV